MVLHQTLLDVSLFVDTENVQVVNIIQGSPSSQLVGMGETGQRIPLIETGDIIVKVLALFSAPIPTITFLKVNSLFVPMQAPDSSITRGPLTLSIRKRGGRTISVIVERGELCFNVVLPIMCFSLIPDVSLSACVV
jgi:hypothetical protein